MPFPTGPDTTYVPSTTPSIKAGDLNDIETWVPYLYNNRFGATFGDGSDGSFVADGVAAAPPWAIKAGTVYQLTRDTALVNLTVTGAGVQVYTGNFRLIGNGTLTTTAGGKVSNNGPAGGGANGGIAVVAGSVGAGTSGANAPNAAAGVNSAAITNAIGGVGGTGGAGGANAGGIGGTVTAPNANLGSFRVFTPQTLGYIFSWAATGVWTQIQGGTGGGSGGSTGGTAVGGGGGAAGGIAVVMFRSLVLANASDISCAGAIGQNGTLGTGTSAGGGAGGGGGGLFIAYGLSNQALSAAVNCPGGAGGTGAGTGTNGAAGANGTLIQFALG